jgi:hypothetical protein
VPTPIAVEVDATSPAIGRPVQFVNVPLVGVPRIGVTRVGVVANTSDPVPVSSVIAVIRLEELGVARNAPTPVPIPEIPVVTGNPVQLVNVPEVGVPRTGAVSVNTPVLALNARLAFVFGPSSPVAAVKKARKEVVSAASFAAMIVGKPVQFVRTPLAGVPNAGVVSVGEVSVLLVRV